MIFLILFSFRAGGGVSNGRRLKAAHPDSERMDELNASLDAG
jgi:hypothetical protein